MPSVVGCVESLHPLGEYRTRFKAGALWSTDGTLVVMPLLLGKSSERCSRALAAEMDGMVTVPLGGGGGEDVHLSPSVGVVWKESAKYLRKWVSVRVSPLVSAGAFRRTVAGAFGRFSISMTYGSFATATGSLLVRKMLLVQSSRWVEPLSSAFDLGCTPKLSFSPGMMSGFE